MTRTELVEKTWEKLGIEGCRPKKNFITVVCDAPPEKIGSIYVSVRHTRFYGPLEPFMVRATVMSVGSAVNGIEPGDRITFSRTFFIRWEEIEPQVMVGWVAVENATGLMENEGEEPVAVAPEGPSRSPTVNLPSDPPPVMGIKAFREQAARQA